MWVLLFITLAPVMGIDHTTFLEKYPTKEACMIERDRIMIEMNKTYPGDTTYTLVCRPMGKGA